MLECVTDKSRTISIALRPLRAWILGVVTLLLVAGVWRLCFYRSQTDRGIEALQAAYSHVRPVESRLTMFTYAPRLITRGVTTDPVDPARRDRAGLLLSEGDRSGWDARTRQAVAVYYLTERKIDQAVGLLLSAIELEPNKADLHSDLSAIYLEQAVAGRDRPAIHDLARSLEHSTRAIRLNGSLLAAHFNRALCLQRMNLVRLATQAWEEYARREGDPGWSGEAAHNVELLREQNVSMKTPAEVLQDFVAAYRDKNETQAWRIHSQTREMITGTMIPFQLIGSQSAIDEAALAFIGEMEKKRTGDPFFAELAGYYSRSPMNNIVRLDSAQRAMEQGYGLCLDGEYGRALTCFEEAQRLFQAVGNRWEAKVADYWIAYSMSQAGKIKSSVELLNELADYCEKHDYHWLKAESYYWLSNNSALVSEHSQVIEQGEKARGLALAIGDLYNAQKNASHIARTYKELRRTDEALKYHELSLPSAADYFASGRQYWRSLNSLTNTLAALGLYVAAEAYQREALEVAVNRIGDPVLIHNTYVRLAQIQTGRGSYIEAEQSLQSSLEAIERIRTDTATRRQIGQSALELGNVKRRLGDLSAALTHYHEALQMFESIGSGMFAYVTRKGMLQCHLVAGDDEAVRRELQSVLSLFEGNRRKIREEQNRNTFFDGEQDVYDLAVDFEYSRDNLEAAFNYAESSRARSLLDEVTRSRGPAGLFKPAASQPLTRAELRERLPADLQLVQYAVLQDRVLIWVLRNGLSETFQSPVSASTLGAIVGEYLSILPKGDADSIERERRLAAQLYDWLFARLEGYLDPEKEVVIVPDKFLFKVPFAALLSRATGRRVVEDYTLLYAPSATVLVLCSELAPTKTGDKTAETLLSVGNPTIDRKRYPDLEDLPNAAAEAREIGSLYHDPAILVGPEAVKDQILLKLRLSDVVHFAGHYVPDDIAPTKSRLMLANAPAPDVRHASDDISLEEIQSMRLTRTKLAILAACRSGIERHYAGEGLIGLSRAFIVAGVPLVIGSQWPVESESTFRLMTQFHKLRKAENRPTTLALRQAQMNLLTDEDQRHYRPYYWSGFFAVGSHANY